MNWVDEDFTLIDKKERFLEAHIATFSRQGSLYDLGKTKAPLSRDFFQASCGVERIVESREHKLEMGGER